MPASDDERSAPQLEVDVPALLSANEPVDAVDRAASALSVLKARAGGIKPLATPVG